MILLSSRITEESNMSEADAIALSKNGPLTMKRMISDLKHLGVRKGMVLLVHSSLSSLGWVCGGAITVIRALEAVLDEEGTLVMPAHSGDLSEPSNWSNPPVPATWFDTIRRTMPPFNRAETPTRGMGVISETFRKMKGVVRSDHPQVSFAARGKKVSYIVDSHELEFGMGEGSPLARLYDLNAHILLLGVGHSNNSSLHLAEYRANFPSRKKCKDGAPIMENGRRVWKEFNDFDLDSDDFYIIGSDFERDFPSKVNKGMIGYAESTLLPQVELVDFAVEWMTKNRK